MKRLEPLTLTELVKQSAELYNSKPTLSFVDDEPVTFTELNSSAENTAGFLSSQGIKKGDKVAILSENMPNWGIAYFGISKTGAYIIPILPDFHENEIKNILEHSEAKTVFVSKRIYPKVEALNKNGEYTFILLNTFCLIPEKTEEKELEKRAVENILNVALKAPSVKIIEDDIAVILYTAGTTGSSKGVMLTHKNLCSNVLAGFKIAKMQPGNHLLSILPLSHSYECTLGFLIPVYAGAHIFYLKKPLAVSVLLPALLSVKPNLMLSVPLLIEKIVRQKVLPAIQEKAILKALYNFPLTHKLIAKLAGKKLMKTFGGELFFFGVGGSGLAYDVERFLNDAGFPYAIGYGLTETSPLLAGANAEYTKFTSTGPIIKDGEVKIINTHEETGEGEILYRGPNVMKGYFKDPEKTAEVLTDGGWFHTGDLGIMDDDGYLYIKGRVKTMILGASGENIYPEAIESVINKFDFIEDSVVFEDNGKIVALVNIDTESMMKSVNALKKNIQNIPTNIGDYTKDLLKKVNNKLNAFSKITKLRHEEKPFEKTPKKTIKRYLYTKFIKTDKKGDEQ